VNSTVIERMSKVTDSVLQMNHSAIGVARPLRGLGLDPTGPVPLAEVAAAKKALIKKLAWWPAPRPANDDPRGGDPTLEGL
jgi:hypothetical protein